MAASLVGIAPGFISTAAADHGGVHCMWGKAYEAKYAYRWGAGVPADLQSAHRNAVATANAVMEGRVVIAEVPDSTGQDQVIVRTDDLGENGIVGSYDGECYQHSSGHYFYAWGDLEYNTYYIDRITGRVYDSYRTGPSGLLAATIHEINHSLGGWHLPIRTTFPVQSDCNSSSSPINPFYPGQRCAPQAGIEKAADIGHLWSRYPSPVRVDCPTITNTTNTTNAGAAATPTGDLSSLCSALS